ncbi:ABC transporter ATP-binding protein [Amygdalobacter nucleatus]|uniref:ABC transporter ATP-binding protein n=1 Tax=Amygdalobacter nucleatus TaxID=3029274 RepID=UPI0027A01F9A|nr:ABC transporter ATP-binding protein [Amygdalobacter nucleatus]WEG37127.1 ABC transporter ATP-binding protein [Amygdalobacter nucleatus]
MSVSISIDNAVKKYGDRTVIANLSLKINEGEFFTLLGPSGCGKTTLLRMIAGFNSIEGGKFYFNDECINDLDPGKRNIGMVFQNYAIFPHMTVRENVAFGLKNRKMSNEYINEQTDKFLELVHILEYADKKPAQLSGGQQQRVALARALVVKPDVLLMDEPLSNLDAKLRVDMRSVIRRLQHDAGITTVYVTHDQEEAMAISDRIAVMRKGEIQHVGKPKAIYQRPDNLFVSSFIGKSNQLEAKLLSYNENYTEIQFNNGSIIKLNSVDISKINGKELVVVARPEDFMVTDSDSDENNSLLSAVIEDSVFLGTNTHYFIHLDDGEDVEVIQESQMQEMYQPGTRVKLGLNLAKINVFDKQTERSIMAGIANDL